MIQSSYQISTIFKIQSLQYLILHSFDPIILNFDDKNILPFTQLKHVSLHSCSITDFLELLKYVGLSVKKIYINLLYSNEDNLSPTIDQYLSDNNISSRFRNNVLIDLYHSFSL